jgi:O-antigen/teichoic acid export membrane protein
LIKRILNSEFASNSIILILGTLAAQVVPILLQPILRRLFTPEEFGTVALYTTAVGMLVSIANLKFESAVIVPKEKEKSNALVLIGILFSFITSLLVLIFMLVFPNWWITFFKLTKNDSNIILFWFLPLSIFFVSSFNCMNMWLIREKKFKLSSLNKLIRRGSEGSGQLFFGFKKIAFGLFWGTLLGDIANFFGAILQLIRNGFNTKCINLQFIKSTIIEFRDFPYYQALPSFLNTISLTLPVFVISSFYGKYETGQFDLSRMVLALPLALISISLSQVFIQRISEKIQTNQSIKSDFNNTLKLLFFFSIPLIFMGSFLAKPVFEICFGPNWEDAAKITQILIFSYALKFIVSPLSTTLIALQKLNLSAGWQIGYFIAISSLYFFRSLSIFELMYCYLLIDLIAYSMYFAIIRQAMHKYEKSL